MTNNPWHLDKKVPLAIILAGVLQCSVVMLWAKTIESTVNEHDRRLAVIDAQRVSERLAALESQMIDVRSSLSRIESKLDRLIETKRDRQ